MTALFAHVNGHRAMIAADTRRVDPAGMIPPMTVRKISCWANCIPFAGTGNGPRLDQIAMGMLTYQHEYTPDESGFLNAFEKYRAIVYAQATSGTSISTSVPKLVIGTVLAAVPAMNGNKERILSLDFATGNVVMLQGAIASDGTHQTVFQAIANATFQQHCGPAGLAGDIWSGDAISQAAAIDPAAVSLLFDIVSTGPAANGNWVSHHMRCAAPPVIPVEEFHLP